MAWKKLRLYPAGHPAREGVVGSAFGQLAGLVAPTGSYSLGVTRDGLMTGDLTLEGPGVKELAEVLYRHNVAVLRFLDGIAQADLEALLAEIRLDVEGEDAGPIAQRMVERGVTHIEIETVDLSELVATESLSGSTVQDDRETSLWSRILALQLEGREAEPDETTRGGTLAEVLSFLRTYLGTQSGGDTAPNDSRLPQLAEGIAQAIESHIGTPDGEAAQAFQIRQVTELLAGLPAELRRPVLDRALARAAGGEGPEAFLSALTTSSESVEMLGSLRRLRDDSFSFSQPALGLIEELALKAPDTQTRASSEDATAMSALAESDLDTGLLQAEDDFAVLLPNTPLQPLELPADFDGPLETLTPAGTTSGLLTILLDLLASPTLCEEAEDGETVTGILDRLAEVFTSLVDSDRPRVAGALFQQLERLAEEHSGTVLGEQIPTLLARLRTGETAGALVEIIARSGKEGHEPIRHLVEVLGQPMIRELLVAQSEADDLSDRRHVFDFLASFPRGVARSAAQLLSDERWYVVRNMIALLATIGDPRSFAQVRGCLRHADERVRAEAARSLIRLTPELPSDVIREALSSDDPKVAERMVQAVGMRGQRTAIAPLVEVLTPIDMMARQRMLRIYALESLSKIGEPSVLPKLKRFFARGLALHSIEERRAAYSSLAGYPIEARRPWVAKGLKSRDSQIHAICTALAAEDPHA